MSRRIVREIGLLLVVVFLITGCAPTLARKSVMDAYLVANPQKLDSNFILGVYWLNERLSKEEGNKDRRTWAFVAMDNAGKISEFLATDYDLWDREKCRKKLLIFIQGEDQVGRLGGVVNRAGLKIYNHAGEEMLIKNPYGKIRSSDYKGFLPVIDPAAEYFLAIKKDSAEFRILDNTIRSNAVFQAAVFKEYVEKKANQRYGVPLGTMIPDGVLERLKAEDDVVKSFAAWAGSGWKAFLSVPFIGASKTLIQMGLFKLMEIPNIYSMVEKEGFATHHPTMEGVADAIDQAESFQACRTELAIRKAMEQMKGK